MTPEDFTELRKLAQWDASRRERERTAKAAQCIGKETFANHADAQRVANRPARHGGARNAYRCRHCNQWHVGTPHPEQATRLYKQRREAMA